MTQWHWKGESQWGEFISEVVFNFFIHQDFCYIILVQGWKIRKYKLLIVGNNVYLKYHFIIFFIPLSRGLLPPLAWIFENPRDDVLHCRLYITYIFWAHLWFFKEILDHIFTIYAMYVYKIILQCVSGATDDNCSAAGTVGGYCPPPQFLANQLTLF